MTCSFASVFLIYKSYIIIHFPELRAASSAWCHVVDTFAVSAQSVVITLLSRVSQQPSGLLFHFSHWISDENDSPRSQAWINHGEVSYMLANIKYNFSKKVMPCFIVRDSRPTDIYNLLLYLLNKVLLYIEI